MRNSIIKKRIASAAAAAIMSVAAVSGSVGGITITAFDGSSMTAYAAGTINFTEKEGYNEGAYVCWQPVDGASGYNVYCDGIQIDSMLIRQYSGYFRADIVGAKAGNHTVKVVPVINGKEDSSKGAEASVTSSAHDRSGFAFQNSGADIGGGAYGCGGYNADGTLASDAQVLYVTSGNVNTVTLDVITNSKGTSTTAAGLVNILAARQKGYDKRPLVIRMVGEIRKENITGLNSSGYLQLKGCYNVTLEGIGSDATVNGWGLLVRSATNVEIRNLGIMLFPDDGVSLDTDNTNIWVHNCDIMYGTAGSDADQAKGDGSADCKGDSKYITFSYNHFWDSGKCSLCGMTSESGENWITYHHNWFDHSDSRHPRIRTMSVHVYNNYYDGNSKYGVGVTMGSSCFVENNYFRSCKYPMLASGQGSDTVSGGTFSGETGGVIKSYGNVMSGQKAYVKYQDNNTDFDAYEASSRTEKVSASVKAKDGGTSYNNFDTGSAMYSYTADAAVDVPEKVMSGAGRVQGGDFDFDFNNSVDDASYAVNQELMAKIMAYQSSVVAIGSGFKEDQPIVTTVTTTSQKPVTTTTVKPGTDPETPVAGNQVHDFTANGTSSSFYTISGNLSTGKGTVNYAGKTLTQCLKMESATSITFNASSAGRLTLVFAEPAATIKVDGTKYISSGDGIITVDLAAGSHSVTKADTANLFYMVYSGSGIPSVTTTTSSAAPSHSTTTSKNPVTAPNPVTPGDVKVVYAGGWNEMAYIVCSGLSDADVKGVSYSGASSGILTGDDFKYLVRDTEAGLRVDLLGLKPGTYSITLDTAKGTVTQPGIIVGEQDRSGYAHFNYDKGVGAYTDGGTLKANAKILYITDENKDTVTLTSKDGTTVTGIGNILNSVGQDTGSGKTSNGGTPNSNKGIIKKIAEDGTPLVIRIVGNVTAPEGLTEFDSTGNGGSVGDNGFMARMKSGKDITIEGVGDDAIVNGWGFHFMCESAAPELGKSFEVRNIAFRNVPEDCIGMEGVQEGSEITASVERCWIHNCEFYVPKIANPAESDKAEGDGACDFKRGQYFTNSYCYYEGYHKTNLVGSSDSSLQYHLTYHHNYWKNCESRGPLARQADIHMYNNIYDGQSSYCQNPRANAFIFSEYNVMKDSKDPVTVKSGGVVKSFNDAYLNVRGDQQATVVTDKSQTVSSSNKYANFDTNASVSYIPFGNYILTEGVGEALFNTLKSAFEADGGCMDNMKITSEDPIITPPDTIVYGDANCNGEVRLNDAVLIMQSIGNPDVYGINGSDKTHITEKGVNNGDVANRGDGLTNADALSIQKHLINLIPALPES